MYYGILASKLIVAPNHVNRDNLKFGSNYWRDSKMKGSQEEKIQR